MNVLVTGGVGFIGSALARHLADRGDDVRVFDNFLTGSKEALPDGIALMEGDLRNPEAVRDACEGVELVFHQGAVRSVPKSVDDPLLTVECNVLGTLNVLTAAHSAGVRRVVYASSSSVYGASSDTIQHEDALPDPRSPYAASKLAAEHLCRVWTSLHGLSTVSLRYFNVFGPGQYPESKYSAVFPAFVSSLLRGEAPELHWDGEQARDFTYITDVVRSNVLAAEADARADGAVINIGGGEPRTINEVYRAVSEALSRRIAPQPCPQRPGDVRRTHADIRRARDLLGWEPRADWASSVAETVRWFRETASE